MYKNTFEFLETKLHCFSIVLLVLFVTFTSYSQTNLLSNGDLESTGGFAVWNYNDVGSGSGSSNAGDYAIVSNPQQLNSGFVSSTDHSGSGNMIVFDSQLNGGRQHFIGLGNNGGGVCALSTAVEHTMSFWMRSVSAGETIDFDVYANDTWIGYAKAPDVNDGWQQFTFTFTPSGQCQNFTFRHVNDGNYTESAGRDFAIDEISLTAPPAPLSINTFTNPASCPNNSDASIEAAAFGGDGNYTYTLQGDGTGTNATGVFIGLAPGNYTVSVADTNNEVAVTPNITLTSPIDITATGDATICNGESTNLSVSGSTSYTWTSVPNDPLMSPVDANQTVSPTQTTVYSVSSVITSDALGITNLLTNGDFAAGNVGFISDYNFRDPNSGKEQKAYGVVANPKLWEEDFATCPDRSVNDDMQLVVDGSADAGNNDRIWSQVDIAVEPGKDYIFSYWLQNVVSIVPPTIETQINGVVMGQEVAPAQACGWVRHFYRWNAGVSNTATISLIDRNTEATGNDFALDDMAFALAVQCTIEKSVTVTVDNPVSATFDAIASEIDYNVSGIDLPELVTTSTNGFTGTWSPATVDSSILGSTEYTFTPDPGQCALVTPVTINVRDPAKTDPTFTLPASICSGDVAPVLPSPSDNGITGTWNPAIVDNTQSASYVFTPDDLILNNTFQYDLTVNQPVTPTFNGLPATSFCINDAAPVLPATSVENFTGTWAPAIDMSVAGTITYTFTPDAGQCATTTTTDITITATVVPTFNGLPGAPICEGDAAPVLPTTSIENFTGSWSPAIDMTAVGTTTYTFTPDAGQCATTATTDLTITGQTLPTFNGLPVVSFCQGDAAPVLPILSVENFTGSWSPAIDMNTIGTSTYTFIPDAGQCASTVTTAITVTTPVVPTFNGLPNTPFCENDTAPVLPILSVENFTGSWSPAIDMTTAGTVTYTFTPDAGQCAAATTTTITVTPPAIPAFNNLPSGNLCLGDTAPGLPTTSVGNITGSWSPAIDMNLVGTATYTFTPDPGQCAGPATTTITVVAPTVPSFNTLPSTALCQNTTAPGLPTTSLGNITGAWSPALDMSTPGTATYTFTPDPGQCATTTTTTITINSTVLPDFSNAVTTVCQNDTSYVLPSSSNGITGTWSPNFDSSTIGQGTYTFTPNDDTQCSVGTTLVITVQPTISDAVVTGKCNDAFDYILTVAPVNNSYDPSLVTYFWTDTSGSIVQISRPDLNTNANPDFKAEVEGSYMVRVAISSTTDPTDDTVLGCGIDILHNVASVFCKIPKGVSPGTGDGNDVFDLSGLNPNRIQIFNRYGYEVYEKTNYTNQWHGQTNTGDDLPASTYYYILELQSGETKTGWVYLAR